MNILRRYKVTPITSGPLLAASMVTGWVIFMPSIVLLLIISHYWNNLPFPPHLIMLLVFTSLALIAFRSIGLVIASVANTMQEGQILVQLLYFPMLLLSGATIPANAFGPAVKAVSKFIPATYLVKGLNSLLLEQPSKYFWLWTGALVLTAIVGWTVGMKLFRWEKEEKIKASAKLWVAAVLAPFLIMGLFQWREEKTPQPNRSLNVAAPVVNARR